MVKCILFTLFFFLACYQSAPAQTALGKAAASLSPGQWAQVSGMTNLAGTAQGVAWDVAAGGSAGPFYDGPQPGWNSTQKKLLLEMTEHGRAVPGNNPDGCPGINFPNFPHSCWKGLVTLDDATSTWTTGGANPIYSTSGTRVEGLHSYGHIAWDDTNQVMYVRRYSYTAPNFIDFFRYCTNATPSYCATQGANTWKAIAQLTITAAEGCCDGALAYMPSLNGGTLLYVHAPGAGSSGCAALYGFRETGGNGTWSTIDAGGGCKFKGVGIGTNYMVPSLTKSVTIFPAPGGAPWWKIDSAGTITPLAAHPNGCVFGSTNGTMSQGAADPVTGDAIFIGCTPTGQLWRLNPDGGGTWTLLAASLGASGEICNISRFPAENCGGDFFATSISTYGVIGYWKFRAGSPPFAEYWIYKPSAGGGGDTTPPIVAMTAPGAGATVSGASVTLSATASDTVGVAGVQFKVDGASVGVEDTSSPYSIVWNSTSVANGSHLITAFARDAAGNTTTSSSVTVTVANAGGGGDFASRCKAGGVVLCVSFDDAAEIACQSPSYCNHGVDINGATVMPVLDTSIKASGNSSLKFTIGSLSGANGAGAYLTNFDQTNALAKQYGQNEVLYAQWRQRFSPEFIDTVYWQLGGSGTTPAGGWKQVSLTTGDQTRSCPPMVAGQVAGSQYYCVPGSLSPPIANYSSCTPIDIPVQNTNQRKYPQAYNSCYGSQSHVQYAGFTVDIPGDIEMQQRPAPGCLYTQQPSAGGKGSFPPNGNCFPYYPNEWMTFKVKLTIGPRQCIIAGTWNGNPGSHIKQCEFKNSHFDMWVGREGQATERVFDFGPYNFSALNMPCATQNCAGDTDPDEKFGKIYLLPYHSYKDDTQVHATAYTWYDDLIISTADIADPGAGGGPTSPGNVRLTGRRIQ